MLQAAADWREAVAVDRAYKEREGGGFALLLFDHGSERESVFKKDGEKPKNLS